MHVRLCTPVHVVGGHSRLVKAVMHYSECQTRCSQLSSCADCVKAGKMEPETTQCVAVYQTTQWKCHVNQATVTAGAVVNSHVGVLGARASSNM